MAGNFDITDLKTLLGESFNTPTYTGDQTVFHFKGPSQSHQKEFRALLYTDYFRMAGVAGRKCHFTVTLQLKHAVKHGPHDLQFIDIRWCNPHLTVRTDENAAMAANRPGVHRSCYLGSEWGGNDPTIETDALPTDADAVKMWNYFQFALKGFVGQVSSMAEDRYL